MCVEVQGCGSELQDPAGRGGVTSRTKGRSTCLPALMRVSVRNWDVNGGDDDPA